MNRKIQTWISNVRKAGIFTNSISIVVIFQNFVLFLKNDIEVLISGSVCNFGQSVVTQFMNVVVRVTKQGTVWPRLLHRQKLRLPRKLRHFLNDQLFTKEKPSKIAFFWHFYEKLDLDNCVKHFWSNWPKLASISIKIPGNLIR